MSTHPSCGAMDAVISVPELLEVIFLYLDLTTLLASVPLVSKKWHDIVSTSPAVQQALYFRPVPTTSSSPHKSCLYGNGIEPVLNPLLIEKFGSCFFDFGPTSGFLRRAESLYTLPWTPHHHVIARRGQRHVVARPFDEDPYMESEAELHRERFTRPGASWRRMLVSQPPPPHLGFLLSNVLFYIGGPHSLSIANIPVADGGLRMGELYDLVQHHASHHKYHSLWFRVIWNRPQAPYMSWMCQHYCGRLLRDTSVLVEFQHKDDRILRNHPRDPPDAAVFDSKFRCKEARIPEFETQEVTGYEPGMRGMDFRTAVWSDVREDVPLSEYTNLWGSALYSQQYTQL